MTIETLPAAPMPLRVSVLGKPSVAAGEVVSMNPSLEERFWAKVVVRGVDECWLWTASLSKGYGQIEKNGRPARAHRLAYEFCVGSIPPGLHVCHHCDVRRCCNPSHLFLGTDKDNRQDAWIKGRQPPPPLRYASENPNSKLIFLAVEFIKSIMAWPRGTQRAIAEMFGVTPTAVWFVRIGKNRTKG